MSTLVEVKNLKKHFPISKRIFSKKTSVVKAVDGLTFTIEKGETLGLVGESGCGKSTTGRMIMRLIEPTEGQVFFNGQDITSFSEDKLRKFRKEFQMIFQDPFASLNPRMKIGDIIEEPLIVHGVEKEERKQRVERLLDVVGLTPFHADRFPHEFSGGQRQRIGIARALAVNPQLIVADEPVSALDVSIQSQILNLLKDLQNEFGLTYLFISHDLSVVEHISDRVGVMYLGRMVELADKDSLYKEPLHPYTKALLSAVPVPDPKVKRERIVLKGDLPSPSNPPSGCTFHTRCPFATEECKVKVPEWKEVREKHYVSCHLY
ncbi:MULTISPECIES: ABC transporter ATP-binding protein [Heyndrickxia]|jgi:oligopeptide/dipeptide ABC transporter ATP-binding protein|uniref:Peptide ABC transporter substrate-binding protein n=1 Tax=Heyndrickxia oleronia TaxID=38875 RepID=A0A8E2IBG5_9BACI|nr:dipeptide ABC transporter ATP-binding protein [Heyndrickxia oleronia]NYV65581.1 dipeptide ABC transporter ATP-binding protein [Bacillus sp. Gen3]OJH20836.1 peptide ABC transporter substrate-binding protein [Bacillus obstructivus]MBU5211489.1 dipeptide ABC transporter ATP-binding protein [Heyndrickxia oleronia]MCI1589121.1 dipeptide ABC transporter ATP-binding protein [Heyndrickxia oleronia]MCI1611787.1 dipeptide ABC transporter ATP-binding protein [Heyndrickxia oleronia]